MCARCPSVLVAALVLGLLAPVLVADEDAPLILLELRPEGPAGDFGLWLTEQLQDQDLTVRWPERDLAGQVERLPSCVVTWSDAERSGDRQRYLRNLLGQGVGMVYVVGTGRGQLRNARSFWANLDIDIEQAGGESGFAIWGRHPITVGLPSIGATDPETYISGPGGTPLIRFGGQTLAAAFDWGPDGRAVIMDQAILGSQLASAAPRPALRQFLVRSVLWAAQLWPQEPGPAAAATVTQPPEPGPAGEPVGPMLGDRAAVDIAADDGGWREIRELVESALERRGIGVRSLHGSERLTPENLAYRGIVVVGATREDFTWAEALALRRYFEQGGRLLLLALDEPRPHPRIIAFNRLLADLELAVSLGRQKGKAEFAAHEITRGLYRGEQGGGKELPVGPGAQVWAWQTEPLVIAGGGVAAAALQTENSRLVIMDAGLLLPYRDSDPGPFITLLNNAIQWLVEQ